MLIKQRMLLQFYAMMYPYLNTANKLTFKQTAKRLELILFADYLFGVRFGLASDYMCTPSTLTVN